MAYDYPPAGPSNNYTLRIQLSRNGTSRVIKMPIEDAQGLPELNGAHSTAGTLALDVPGEKVAGTNITSQKISKKVHFQTPGGPYERGPRHMKFTRRNDVFYWYKMEGDSDIPEPPAIPDSFNMTQDVVFIHSVGDGEHYQHWWRSAGANRWTELLYGEERIFHGETYRFTVTQRGDASWVNPITFKQKHSKDTRI